VGLSASAKSPLSGLPGKHSAACRGNREPGTCLTGGYGKRDRGEGGAPPGVGRCPTGPGSPGSPMLICSVPLCPRPFPSVQCPLTRPSSCWIGTRAGWPSSRRDSACGPLFSTAPVTPEFGRSLLRAASEPQPGGQGVCWMRFGAWPALTRRYAQTAGLLRLGREPERRSVGLGWVPDAWLLEGVEKRRSGSHYYRARGNSNLALGFPAPGKQAAHERGRDAGRKRASFMIAEAGGESPVPRNNSRQR
jgi:hypothetical protein